MTEEQRKAIVEGPTIYLHNRLKVALGGWMNTEYCTITSALPGFWACDWERVKEVQESEAKRFDRFDLWKAHSVWLGLTPSPADFQTEADYEQAKARGEAR